MTQAQPLSARDHPDLQYNEALAAKRMKGMGYLGRSQSLTGPECSSKQPCQPCWIASSSKRGCRFCKGDGTRRFPNTATGFDRVDRRITLWLKRRSTSRQATDG